MLLQFKKSFRNDIFQDTYTQCFNFSQLDYSRLLTLTPYFVTLSLLLGKPLWNSPINGISERLADI